MKAKMKKTKKELKAEQIRKQKLQNKLMKFIEKNGVPAYAGEFLRGRGVISFLNEKF